MWDLGVLLSAVVAGTEFDRKKYEPEFAKLYSSLDQYWSVSEGYGAYNSELIRPTKHLDRYYDDNAWVGIALADAYRVTRDRRYLLRAQEVCRYVESGRSKLGGVCWREAPNSDRNACSTLPAAVLNLRLYLIDHEAARLTAAQAEVDWVRSTHVDPKDGLVWDHVEASGKVEKTKWTYNTAMLIKSDYLLWRATGNHLFLEQSQSEALKAIGHWRLKPDIVPFMHLLVEASLHTAREYSERHVVSMPSLGGSTSSALHAPAASMLGVACLASANKALNRGHNSEGWFGAGWAQPPTDKSRQLLWQASIARLMWVTL